MVGGGVAGNTQVGTGAMCSVRRPIDSAVIGIPIHRIEPKRARDRVNSVAQFRGHAMLNRIRAIGDANWTRGAFGGTKQDESD